MVGAGLVVIGVGMGIGRIGGSAMEAIGRQPDAYGKIQTAMLIAAALARRGRFPAHGHSAVRRPSQVHQGT